MTTRTPHVKVLISILLTFVYFSFLALISPITKTTAMTPRAIFSPVLPKPAPTASAAHRIRQKPNKTAMTMPILVLFIIGKPPVLRLESSDTAVIIAVPRTLYDLFLASHRWGTKAQGLFCHSNFAYARFHGTEPLYHNLLRLHILRMKDIELFKEVIL